MPAAKLRSFFKQGLQIALAGGKAIGELKTVVCLNTLTLMPRR